MQGVYRKYYRLDSSTHNKNKSRRIRFSLLNWDPILGPNTEDNQTAEVEEKRKRKKEKKKKKKKGEKLHFLHGANVILFNSNFLYNWPLYAEIGVEQRLVHANF